MIRRSDRRRTVRRTAAAVASPRCRNLKGPIQHVAPVTVFGRPAGCVALWAERRSLAGELTLSCARPAANG